MGFSDWITMWFYSQTSALDFFEVQNAVCTKRVLIGTTDFKLKPHDYSIITDCKTIEPPHDKTNKMACAPSEDSDQPRHPPSLIRVFAVRMKKAWVLSYPLNTQRRLIRLGGCPGWSESSLGAQPQLVFSWGGSISVCVFICKARRLTKW